MNGGWRMLGWVLAGGGLLAAQASAATNGLATPAKSPRLEARVSWIGNTLPGARGHVPQDIDALCAAPDGTVFSNVHWEEGGGNVTAFKFGKVLGNAGHTHGWGNQGGYAVAANVRYLFIGGRMNNEGGGLKDPDTWPPKGFDWIGVSRRPLGDYRQPAPFAGGKGGKGDTLKGCFLVVDEVATVKGSSNSRLQNITGMAASATRLYVSCPYDQTIKVFDTETMARVAVWPVRRPGPLALDAAGQLWVLQAGEENKRPAVLCLDATGREQARKVGFEPEVEPVALAFDGRGRLLVADDGVRQQVILYEVSGTVPVVAGFLGVPGGIYAGTPGQPGPLRFNRPRALACDKAGNIHVAHGGSTGGGSTVLESYSPGGQLNWQLHGLLFVDMADVEAGDDTQVFTKEERFTLDYSRTNGQEWAYAGYTYHRFQYPDDMRRHIWSAGAWVRRVESQRLLFVNDMNGQHLQVYRLGVPGQGEIAVPAGLFAARRIKVEEALWPPGQPEKGEWIWRDLNGNGKFEREEYVGNNGSDAPASQGWWVDAKGQVWQASETAGIRLFGAPRLTAAGVPQWDWAGVKSYPKPPELQRVKRLRYDPVTDTMYLGGTTPEHVNQHWKPMGPVICRYDQWSTPQRKLRWQAVAPYAKGSQGHESCEPMGFDVAGDYLFLPYTGASKAFGFKQGHVEVLRAADGAAVGHFEPSAEVGEIGLQDVRECLRAHRRANGEYLVLLEEDFKAKVLLYRWRDVRREM